MHKTLERFFYSLMLVLMLLISVSVSAATESRQYLSAQWFLEGDTLQERVKNSVWLTLIGEQEIAGMIKVPVLKVNDLFIEKSSAGTIYTTKMIAGKRKHVAQIKYDIYPAKSGDFILPEMPMSIDFASKQSQPVTILAEPLNITVEQQPDTSRGLIITPSLKITQKVSDREFFAGGIISREISLTVKDLPGYLIAELPLKLTNIDADVRVAKNTTNTDAFRGETSGKRTTKIQYRYAEAGEYTLPKVNVNWWDPTRGIVVQSSIDAIDIVVTPLPPLPFKQRLQAFYTQAIETIQEHKVSILLFSIFVLLAWWWRAPILKRIKVGYVHLQRLMKTPLIMSMLFIINVAIIPKEKLTLLLKKWIKGVDKSLQTKAKETMLEVVYSADGHIRVTRLRLLKKVCRVVWLQYYQRFTLQPLNPK